MCTFYILLSPEGTQDSASPQVHSGDYQAEMQSQSGARGDVQRRRNGPNRHTKGYKHEAELLPFHFLNPLKDYYYFSCAPKIFNTSAESF
jgi:hypothetical protein